MPLWLFIVAAFACDLSEGVIAAFGVNDPLRVWSHSVPAAAVAGTVLALAWRACGGSWRGAGAVWLVSMSHVPLDVVTATKTFLPGLAPFGLNLYQRPFADAAVEGALCVAGWMVWRRSLATERQSGSSARAMLTVLLIAQSLAFVSLLLGGGSTDPDALSKFIR